MITVDATSNSGVKAGVSSISWNHTVSSGSDRFLVFGVAIRDGSLTDIGVASATFNGDSMTEMITREGAFHAGNFGVEIWGIFAPDVATGSIAITLDGTVDHAGAFALSLFGANQSTTPDATQTGLTNTFDVNDPSLSITTVADNCYIFDAGMDVTDFGNLTVGANQTQIGQLGTNGGGDTAESSYEAAGAAGAHTMSWSTPGAGAGMDAWVSACVSIAPAATAGIRSMRQVVGHGQGTRS